MKTSDIRQQFIDYFRDRGHTHVPSSPLVPANDPTLLFTNAGMVQFKDVFLGAEKRPYQRAVTAQRCVRAGGKHNDLENVGYTARHHTFFEMLGNFSFGDYFKHDAVHYAWELLTRGFGLPEDKLWVTVFEDDDEAADIWLDDVGIDRGRFARIGAHDNFWAMGDTGPCGPCSEIFYDHGPEVAGGPPGSPDADGDRYVEIWNLVFMQFNRDASGDMQPLPRPSVDTGMGIERLAAVLQGVHDNYDTDLFRHLIDAAALALDIEGHEGKALRVIADHIRASAFLVTDGVLPSNEGRGYVLRRIIRRAVRHGYQAGGRMPFFHRLVAPLVEEMGEAYPELPHAQAQVEKVLRAEEERFAGTLEHGLRILDQEIKRLDGGRLPGELVFRLYDTYGFPADLTADVAREHGLGVDMAGFEREMTEQRSRARAASQFATREQTRVDVAGTDFTGYEELSGEAQVLALLRDGQPATRLDAGDAGIVVLDRTPFYAEGGGQIGDRGRLRCGEAVFEVTDTRELANDVTGHFGRLRLGRLARGDRVRAEIDVEARLSTMNNHSATHLLHAALKAVLGSHVQQKGSLVEPQRLRFDFSHFEPVTREQLREIENLVNAEIRANHDVQPREMALDEARTAGAEALFGEKYGERVRTIRMGEFSFELCGGTHVRRTGDIGYFKIVSEGGISAGVRRLEAMTGQAAVDLAASQSAALARIAERLRGGRDEIEDKLRQLQERNRELEREVAELGARVAMSSGTDLGAQARDVGGAKVLAARVNGADAKALRSTVDRLKGSLGRAVIMLGSTRDDKVTLIAGVTGNLTDTVKAGELMQYVASRVGGKGGGRPDLAQGGGTLVQELDPALESVYEWVEQRLGSGG